MASAKQRYDNWRANEVHKVGPKMQNQADANLDYQASQPFVELRDTKTGAVNRYRKNVAGVLAKRDGYETVGKVMSIPSQAYQDNYDLIDWSKDLKAKSVYVSEDGNDKNPGTEDLPKRTISNALQAVAV